jgi:fructokinase
MHRIGIDLGGTKIEGVVLDAAGAELLRRRVPTGSEDGYDAILARIRELYGFLAARLGGAEHTLGIGTPGAVSARTGLMKNCNTVCLNGKPLREDLQRMLARRFALQNDANCFALAEALRGAGRGRDLVFGVIMGTGCGGGIVFRGEARAGLQAIAGEWGHTSIAPDGPACYCGNRGCVETYISGGGLQNRYAEAFGRRRALENIVADYRAADPPTAGFMREFFRNFGRALANVINILDPDIVVLGGGVSNVDELYTEGVREVARCVFSDSLETPIVRHELGDSAGVIGAALIGV